MAKVIVVANQKGGVAKTTTALALAMGLYKLYGKRVLLVDTDPQCNATDTYKAKVRDTETLYDLLCHRDDPRGAVQKTEQGDIIPSDPLLSQSEDFLNRTGKEFALKEALEPLLENYDYIIVDTPPTLGILLVNALTAADTLIIPIMADRFSLQGLAQLNDTVKAVKQYTNQRLYIAGLLVSKYHGRENLSRDIMESIPAIASDLETIVFNTTIRESVAAREAQAIRESLFDYSVTSTTAQDYITFINELIERGILK